MIFTKSAWTSEQWAMYNGPDYLPGIQAKSNEMAAQGKTDGISTVMPNPGHPDIINQRTWIDLAAAEEWQAFIATYNPVWSVTYDESGPL